MNVLDILKYPYRIGNGAVTNNHHEDSDSKFIFHSEFLLKRDRNYIYTLRFYYSNVYNGKPYYLGYYIDIRNKRSQIWGNLVLYQRFQSKEISKLKLTRIK